jgi:hypothetical protein
MGRDDFDLMWDPERFQGVGGVMHGVPVRLATHDNSDHCGVGHCVLLEQFQSGFARKSGGL